MAGNSYTENPRYSDLPIDPLFLERWSPRAFDGSVVVEKDLAIMLEAARWAPSAFNVQPWRFICSLRNDPDWQRSLEVLLPFNAGWANSAGALIFVCSDKYVDKKDKPPEASHSHSFDAGAAWAMLAMQATRLGYYTHGMTGLNFEQAPELLQIPDRFRLEAAVAIGRMGDKSQLPENLQAREQPSDRKQLDEMVFQGRFGQPYQKL